MKVLLKCKGVNHLLQEGSFLGYAKKPRNYQWMKIIDQKSGCGDLEIDGGGKDMTRMTLPVSFNEPSFVTKVGRRY